jgi:hypothetical protein
MELTMTEEGIEELTKIRVGSICQVVNPSVSNEQYRDQQIVISKVLHGTAKTALFSISAICIETEDGGRFFENELELKIQTITP